MRSLFDEVIEADGIVNFFTGHLFEFVFRFLGDSISNMVQAFVWFLPLLSYRSPLGIILLGIGFYVFDIYLREPIANWLLRVPATDDLNVES